jgi:putative PEP-CTERM system histidine kinase
MLHSEVDLPAYGYTAAAVVFTAFAIHLLRAGYLSRAEDGRSPRIFLFAVVASAAWAWAEACSRLFTLLPQVALALDWLRYGLWFAFLLQLLGQGRGRVGLTPTAGVLLALAAVGFAFGARQDASLARPAIAAAMALAVYGLMLTEQLFRNLGEDFRWNAKPVCLGLACVFAFDLYIFSEALLFGRFDSDAAGIRGPVHALAVPLLFVASRRHRNWLGKLQVSRTAAFYSATLLLAGAYLLFIAAIGYYVRFFGGDWGRALQIALLVAALVALGAMGLSGSLRARLRVFVAKNFFSYRYDYRKEWLRFTAMLSSGSSPQELNQGVIRGLADMMESKGGSLWLRAADGRAYTQAARWNAPENTASEPADSALVAFLLASGWIVDVAECRRSPQRYRNLALPAWLETDDTAWLVVPLAVADSLIGFVVLTPPRTAVELNWESTDLLKTAARQAAGFLAQMQATEALLEARKFDAFNRMSAFVVHDLKNIVTQLSLMTKNAKRLHANPEFQQDMLLTVDSSLDKMRQLMLQLREGAAPPGGSFGVDLAAIARRIESVAASRGRTLEVELVEKVSTRGHEERIERVLGHLVQNAFDATPPERRVWFRLDREAGRARVQVGDEGQGMSEDFVRNRLGKPFQTTKAAGMGIGSYESFQYVRELGGSIDVASQPGQGTVVTVRLPLLEAGAGSELRPLAPSN